MAPAAFTSVAPISFSRWTAAATSRGSPATDRLDSPATADRRERAAQLPANVSRARASDPTTIGELLVALAVDRVGNLYIGDAYNNRVRKVSASGVISTLAGNGDRGEYGVSADANGTWSTKDDIEDGGQATAAPITWPSGIAVGEDGTIFVTSNFGWFFRITAQGIISTILTHDCGWSQHELGLCAPHGIALHPSGDILAADVCRIRKLAARRKRIHDRGGGDSAHRALERVHVRLCR